MENFENKIIKFEKTLNNIRVSLKKNIVLKLKKNRKFLTGKIIFGRIKRKLRKL